MSRHTFRPLLARLALAIIAAVTAPAAAGAQPFAYVADLGSGDVSQYAVGAGGLLSPLTPPTVPEGTSPTAVATSLDGRSVYVADLVRAGVVAQFDVGPAGTLTPKTPATVAAGSFPVDVTASPDGRSVYVVNEGEFGVTSGSVSQYDVGPTGALTPKSPATVPAGGTSPERLAISPNGRTAYVTNGNSATVSIYDVGPTGALTLRPVVVPLPTAGVPRGVATTPDGRHLYVVNSMNDYVAEYDVGTDGSVTPKLPPDTTVPTGGFPVEIRIGRDGRSAYVSNEGTGGVSQYDVGADGLLSPKTPAAVGAGRATIGLAVSADGRSVYATNQVDGTVSQYDAGPAGALSAKTPATVAAGSGVVGSGPTAIALTPPGCRMTGSGDAIDQDHAASKFRVMDALSSDRARTESLDFQFGPASLKNFVTGASQTDRFHLTRLTNVFCGNDPALDPGQGQTQDTITLTGAGTFRAANSGVVRPGYTVTLVIKDGEDATPNAAGAGKDFVHVKVSDDRGTLVRATRGTLAHGNEDARDGP